MANTIKIITEIPQEDGSTIKQKFNIEFDADVSSEIILKYLSPEDGGPVMRPSNPPK
jgi:hypothetical protein